MKTIKERAKEAAIKEFGEVARLYEAGNYMLGYIKGATDQRSIDIEAACELAMTYLLVTTPKEVADERLKRFREALEESKTL